MVTSGKIATHALLKIRVFWKKGFYVIYSVYDVTNKILSYDSNYIMDLVMCPKFGNSKICIREVIITSTSWGFDQKNAFFEGLYWFKLNNLRLALGANLKLYTKRLATESQKVLAANSYVCRSYRAKTGRGGPFCYPPPHLHLE